MVVVPVSSYADYRNIIKGKKLINNGFLPTEINKYITQKRLSYCQFGNRLFLLYNEMNYYQLVCESIESHDMSGSFSFELPKPVVCHIVVKKNNSSTAEIIKFLQASGYRLRCTIHEFVRESLDDLPDIPGKAVQICNKIKGSSDCQEILSLWQNNLPLYEVPYMLPEDIQLLSDKYQLIYLKDCISGRIIGARFYDVFLGTTTGHHNVVGPYYRGKGYGGVLLNAWLLQARQLGARIARVWIEDKNVVSQNNVSKVGFVKTSNLSYQYIKNVN